MTEYELGYPKLIKESYIKEYVGAMTAEDEDGEEFEIDVQTSKKYLQKLSACTQALVDLTIAKSIELGISRVSDDIFNALSIEEVAEALSIEGSKEEEEDES